VPGTQISFLRIQDEAVPVRVLQQHAFRAMDRCLDAANAVGYRNIHCGKRLVVRSDGSTTEPTATTDVETATSTSSSAVRSLIFFFFYKYLVLVLLLR
jgi:hypothetical protein